VRSNITQLVDRLESDGLVARVNDPVDRRAVRAEVTPLGKERFSAGTRAIRAVQSELASRLGEHERETFMKALATFSIA
jgi:DNA-binding MarR family transcriptional regulator